MNYLILIILPIVQILLLIFMNKKNKKFTYLIVSIIMAILSFITALYSTKMIPEGLGGIGAALLICGCVVISIILFLITLCCFIKIHLNSKGKKSFWPIVLLLEILILIICVLLRILGDL